METLAETGKRRRLHRLMGQLPPMDSKRLERPVFLSYSAKDKRMANGLRRNLELKNIPVWYASSVIEGGEIWRKHINEGIEKAIIFVALVTANYLESAHCFGELIGFHSRIESGDERNPLLLPILCIPQRDVSKNQNFGPILRDFQGIDLSTRFVDGLTLLLARIQARIPEQIKDSKYPSYGTIPPSPSGKIA